MKALVYKVRHPFCKTRTRVPALAAALILISSLLITKPTFTATTSASGYRELGLRYRQQEHYSEAIAALKKSVELDPQDNSTRVILGWTFHLAGQEDAAAEALRQAIYRDFFNIPALNALGIVCLVNGDLNDAVAVHSWALFLQPNNEIADYNLSLAYHRLHKYGWAITMARRAAALEPTNPHPLIAQAIAHWDNAEPTLAQTAYRQALSLDPRYGDHTFLAQLQIAGFSSTQIQIAKKILAAKGVIETF